MNSPNKPAGLGALALDKGVPVAQTPEAGANLFTHVPMPAAAILKPVLERNSRWMRDLLRVSGVSLAPHGKTTMIPEIFHMQIADGAWGITLSTLHQVRTARRFGIDRIFLANILADPAEIRAIYEELEQQPDFDFYCLIDSAEALQALAAAFPKRERSRPINVLVELGFVGGRTGLRTVEAAMKLARAASQAGPALRLVGVEAFEGLIKGRTEDERDRTADRFVAGLSELAIAAHKERLFAIPDFIVSAGGTNFIDLVVAQLSEVRKAAPQCRLLIRSGCYIAFDSGLYKMAFARMASRGSPGFASADLPKSALEIWARVLSRPEPGRLIVGAGKRDMGNDMEMPHLVKWLRPSLHGGAPAPFDEEARVVELNDQHAHVEIAESNPVAFGDFVAFGVSHPCTTFDKWRRMQLVNGDYSVAATWSTYF